MTTTTTSTTEYTRGDLTIRANLAKASAPIELLDGEGEWTSTPFQTADARHSAERALDLVESWLASDE